VPHAILVGPEKNLLGRRLIADPLYDDWQFVPEDKLKAWAQAFRQSINFAVSKQPAPDTAGGTDVPDISTYLPGYTATIKKDASIRAAPSLTATKLRGTSTQELWTVTGWVKGEAFNGSTQWLTRWDAGRWEYTVKDNVTAGPTAPTGSGYTQAQLDAAVAAQKLADEAIKDAAVSAAVEAEQTRISGVLGI
jgi:hypothetical protein